MTCSQKQEIWEKQPRENPIIITSSNGWKHSLTNFREESSYKGVGVIPREKVSGMFLKSFRRYN